MASLPGTKMLILGNHDKKSGRWFINNGFDYAVNYLVYNNILFTHKPVDNLGYEEKVNIHGHIHNNIDAIKKLKPFNVNYSIEIENYRPVLLEMLLRNRNKQ
jgi:calcineurin-like phosphoesterase family protein